MTEQLVVNSSWKISATVTLFLTRYMIEKYIDVQYGKTPGLSIQ